MTKTNKKRKLLTLRKRAWGKENYCGSYTFSRMLCTVTNVWRRKSITYVIIKPRSVESGVSRNHNSSSSSSSPFSLWRWGYELRHDTTSCMYLDLLFCTSDLLKWSPKNTPVNLLWRGGRRRMFTKCFYFLYVNNFCLFLIIFGISKVKNLKLFTFAGDWLWVVMKEALPTFAHVKGGN